MNRRNTVSFHIFQVKYRPFAIYKNNDHYRPVSPIEHLHFKFYIDFRKTNRKENFNFK